MTLFALSETGQIVLGAVTAFFSLLSTIAAGVIGVYMARLSHEMNSMKDALVKASNIAGHAEGVEAERNRPPSAATAQGVTMKVDADTVKVDAQSVQVGEPVKLTQPDNGGKDRPKPPPRAEPQ